MNKPDYLHSESLASAVLSGTDPKEALRQASRAASAARKAQEHRGALVHGTAARHLLNSNRNIDAESHDQAEDEIESWLPLLKSVSARTLQLEQWYSECVLWAHDALQNSVEIDPGRRGGVPVLKGTRFTVGQTLAELADSAGVPEVAAQFDLDEQLIRDLLYGLALLADKPRP